MKHILGIGGIFFKAHDPEKLAAWYQQHLGLDVEEYGGVTFRQGEVGDSSPRRQAHTVWSPFAADTDYFAPSEKPFMINFRVADLATLLVKLRAEGVTVDERTEKSEFGYFGWAIGSRGEQDRTLGTAAGLRRSCFIGVRLGGEGFEPPTYWV